jgi:hypothetical protein
MCVMNDLTVDPTCGGASVCSSDGASLAAYRSGTANNCLQGINKIQPACQTIVDRINKNNCSCKPKAADFVSKDCLTKGFTTTKCLNAYNGVRDC